MSANRAGEDLLDKLHRLTAEKLIERLESGGATAAEMTAAINFLAKNDIKAVPVKGSPLDRLGDTVKSKGVNLPFEGAPTTPNTPH